MNYLIYISKYHKKILFFMKRKLSFFLIVFFIFIFSNINSQTNQFLGINTIVIDPGHGGKDPGTLGTGRYSLTEKDIALDISLKLGSYINKEYPNINVIYTRDDDTFVKLSKRSEIANMNQADLFISIHCDAFTSETVYGTTTYVMGAHKTKSNLEVAMRENSSILLEDNFDIEYSGFEPNKPESYIALTLYQSENINYGLNFASKVQKEFKQKKRKDRGIKQAGFLVLSRATMPSVLIETGFLTNKAEEDYLNTENGRIEIASGIFSAVKMYKNELEAVVEQRMDELINIDKNNNVNVFFSVQFFSSEKEVDFKNKKLDNSLVLHFLENNLHKYCYGKAKSYDSAKNYQNKLKEIGFYDSFIVAFVNGNKTEIKKAIEMIKKD